MKSRTKIIAATTIVLVTGIGAGVALASGPDAETAQRGAPPAGAAQHDTETETNDSDRAISSAEARQRASDAALAYIGEGRVTETEEGDEESYYEVEVTREDGSQVDVQLDESFKVVGSSADEERAGDR